MGQYPSLYRQRAYEEKKTNNSEIVSVVDRSNRPIDNNLLHLSSAAAATTNPMG